MRIRAENDGKGRWIFMRKIMKGTVVIAMTAGLSLWNMESQKAVALAPVTYHNNMQTAGQLWEESLQMDGKDRRESQAVMAKVTKLEKLHTVRVKQHRLEVKRAKAEKRRLERLAQIQACCGVRVSEKDRNILERIVEAEAGNQDHKGKLLVANVILNRVKNKAFPSTIKGVVFSPGQFSPISDGRYETVTVSVDTKKAVDDALQGIDCSQGALYFMERSCSDSSNVTWFDSCLTRLFRHQSHEFFK